jgi:hypothetical protein
MSERLRPIDLAGRLGISKQLVNAYITQGMPIDSIESAESWVMSRRAVRGGTQAAVTGDKDFNETVERQRELKALAHRKYLDDLANDSPDASKSYSTYDKLVKTLITMEKELHARQIASREFIRTQTAIERFGKILTNLRNELTQLGTKVASRANPDHPGRALKAIDEEMTRILSRVSEAVAESEEEIKMPQTDIDPTEAEATTDEVDDTEE